MEKNTPGKYSGTNTHRDNIKGQNNLTFQSKYELIKYLVQRKHTQATEFYLILPTVYLASKITETSTYQ